MCDPFELAKVTNFLENNDYIYLELPKQMVPDACHKLIHIVILVVEDIKSLAIKKQDKIKTYVIC